MRSRMTIEELKEFNPNYTNPVQLVSDKVDKNAKFHVLVVLGVVGDKFFASDATGKVSLFGSGILKDYPSLKPEEPKFREVVMYQAVVTRDLGYARDSLTIHNTVEEALCEEVIRYGVDARVIGYKPITVYLREGEK